MTSSTTLGWISMSTAWPPHAVWLVQQDAPVRERLALTPGPPRSKTAAGEAACSHADRRDVALHVLHRVVDRELRRDVAARRVDVQLDVLAADPRSPGS